MLPHLLIKPFAILADCYTPVLLVIVMKDIVIHWRNGHRFQSLRLCYAALVVYSWMFIDKAYQLWASKGLDYSTHSAAALALIVVIGQGKSLLNKVFLIVSLVTYAFLMYLLNYHSWGDMFTTLAVISFFLIPLSVVSKTPIVKT